MSVTSLLDLHGRVAVVTGGAGAIGAAICARLIESGALAYCLDRAGQTAPTGATACATSERGR